ncbi:MAG: response regulator [Clostridiales bacterium]
MYKVFVVDDEIVVREGIRDEMNWKEIEFEFVGEAADGELALMQIKEIKPDILITDIKMPFMDGLKLSKIVRKNMPWMKIIILSGHDEFDYAKEAISIGVAEYMLKPIGSDDLLKILLKMKKQIEFERRERENIEKIKNELDSNMPMIKSKFLCDILYGTVDLKDIFDNCKKMNIDIKAKYYLVVVLDKTFDDKIREDMDYKYNENVKADSIVSSVLESDNDTIFFKKDNNQTVIIFKSDEYDLIEDMAYSYSQSLKYEVERNVDSILTIGIGTVYDSISGILKSHNEAQSALKYKFVIGKSKIIGYKDVKSNISMDSKDEIDKMRKIKILSFLKFGVSSNINDFLDKYTEQLVVQNENFQIYSYHFLIDIIINSINFLDELNGDYKKVLPEFIDMNDFITSVDSIDKFRSYSTIILNRVFEFRDNKIKNKYGNIIHMAKKYIEKHYFEEDISLNVVSAHVNVSPSHFSTIFSQETEETFIEYLTKTRIQKAMELLRTTNQRSSEIAYNVGYNDPRYFTYLFKKTTKKTPIEFRNTGSF